MGIIGDNIKSARKNLGLTQAQLAEMANITTAAVSRYESGLREPRIEHLRSIANALDVTVGYLEGYESINSKQLVDAVNEGDTSRIEELMGLPHGSVKVLSFEEENRLKSEEETLRAERNRLFIKLRIKMSRYYKTINEKECDDICDLVRAFAKLNSDGRKRAIDQVEELTEIPKYKKEPPQD